MKNLSEALVYFEHLEIFGKTDISFESIAYNSAKVNPNSLFVAIRGTNTDGHFFIPEAIKNGAVIIVCENFQELFPENITFIKVQNSRKALAELSNFWYDFPAKNLKISGITGTNGKTTTAFLIQSFLKKLGKRSAVIGTTGIFFDDRKIPATHTTPESLELYEIIRKIADSGIKYVIMEVSSHSLIQNRVFGINFDIAIFTNLTHDHLDFHKTIENYAKAKRILFDGLSENSIAIINADTPFSAKMLEFCKSKNIYYITRNFNLEISKKNGIIKKTKIQIQDEHILISGNTFLLNISEGTNSKTIHVKSPLIGKFNIDNLTYSIAAILGLNFDLPELHNNTDFLRGAAGRMEVIHLPNGALGIVDYAHTPDALEKALQTLREIISSEVSSTINNSKIICVFGCGGNRDKFKRPIMGKIASELSEIVIITSDNPRNEDSMEIISEIYQGISFENRNKISIIEDRQKAIERAYSLSSFNDLILVAGKGHEDYQLIGSEKHHFDDREILKNQN